MRTDKISAKEILLQKNPARRKIEVAENMIRLALFAALDAEHPKCSVINRQSFYGIDITEIKVATLKREHHLTIKVVKTRTLTGWDSSVFFDTPPEVKNNYDLKNACEDYRKIITGGVK